jgi:hypothetical protein
MAFSPPAQSSATSLPLPDPEAYPGEPREYARALMQRKDEIECEIVRTEAFPWSRLMPHCIGSPEGCFGFGEFVYLSGMAI